MAHDIIWDECSSSISIQSVSQRYVPKNVLLNRLLKTSPGLPVMLQNKSHKAFLVKFSSFEINEENYQRKCNSFPAPSQFWEAHIEQTTHETLPLDTHLTFAEDKMNNERTMEGSSDAALCIPPGLKIRVKVRTEQTPRHRNI